MKPALTCALGLSLLVSTTVQAGPSAQWTSYGYGGDTWEIGARSDAATPANTVLAGASLPASGPSTATAELSTNSYLGVSRSASYCGIYDGLSFTLDAMRDLVEDASGPDVSRSGTGWLVGASGAVAWSGPSQECATGAQLPRACEVVEIARSDGWLLVDILVAKRRTWVRAQDMRAATVTGRADATNTARGRELWVDGINVRLRAGPGTTFTALASLQSGAKVLETGRIQHWLAVESVATGLAGWVYEPLLSERPLAAPTSADLRRRFNSIAGDEENQWVVIQPFIRMRHLPDPSAPVVDRLLRGTEVRALAVDGEWLQVTAPGSEQVGWVHGSGMELERIVAAGAAAFIEHLGKGNAVSAGRETKPTQGTKQFLEQRPR